MANELDAYRDWLGITETNRPLNFYQLLRLRQFEDQTAKIREHYRKMNAHVRKFATGEFAARSQELLNELARAMLCLTDDQRKRDYDASLGRKQEGPGRHRSLEEILLGNKAIDQSQLDKARNYAKAVGLEVRDALVQQKAASPDVVMLAYAESIGLPCVDLADVGVDESLVPQVPSSLARQHSCVPVLCDRGQLLMASPNPLPPDVEEELRLRLNMPVRTVLCTAGSINPLITKYYARDTAPAGAPAAGRGPAGSGAQAKQPAAKKGLSMPSMPKVFFPKFSLPRFSFGGGGGGDTKSAMMFAIVAFNLTAIVVVIARAILRSGVLSRGEGWATTMGLAAGLGVLAAVVTFFVASRWR
ncbi:MAG: hypothetical protein ABR915_13535 [Thermoguttaceae bacterium]|jgi:hypothetical protein